MTSRIALTAMVSCALVAAGCGSDGSRVGSHVTRVPASGSPLQVTVGWFGAINARNAPLARSYFTPEARPQMDWSGGVSDWSSFTRLHCKTVSRTPRSAEVYCTFDESASPSEGNPSSFWDVYLRYTPRGWFIDNYGQG
ncbi:MAG: hypothetical protein ABR946_09760 [Solirubrobacteraceae bacterium]|jgi:hypothetical protein